MATLANMVRVGTVSVIDPDRCAVRVVFPDRDDLVSDFLPVVVLPGEYVLPKVNDRVLCLFLGNGLETGFCLGSFYFNASPPPTTAPEKRGTWYRDGSYIDFDEASGTLAVHAKGKVIIKAASGLEIAGDVHISGNLTVDGSITGGGVSV
ncbi:phage baseplate assembly protein V [Paenibacillus tyrfis]|uniref:Baseplate assembly protein n=1 Tax=Paenibacillus tyrfis TaxID=1501230 RepID=A0A081NV30_9BACL|nr:phage baseplate assembly protein V [Paenibacillus tyrfis]KEQ22303.1 hypothetical protein ET33_26380 [Paenibacillus tyrfis]